METSTNDDVTTDRSGFLGNVLINGIELSADIMSDEGEQVGQGPDMTAGDVWLFTGVTIGGSGLAANVTGGGD